MKKCKMFNSQRGQTLMFAIIVVLVLLVFISTLNKLLKHDTELTVKHKRSTTAFHLAEAAVDRGLWKLRESKDIWDNFAEGAVEGYNNDVPYTDIEGGTYKIGISTTSEEIERKIIGTGRDSSTNEIRVIELIVKHVSVEAAIYSPELSVQGNVKVHWGPIKATSDMTVLDDLYPRKYAVGQIDPRDTHYDEGDPETANSDGVEYWAWYPVKTPPAVDKIYYLEKAASEGGEYYGPADAFAASHGWPVPTALTLPNGELHKNVSDDTERIYYVRDQDCTLKNCFLVGTLIVDNGNLINGGGGKGDYWANIPENALDEYAACDGYPDPDDMPGHPGPPTITEYEFTPAAGPKIAFHGFIYVSGNWSGTGGQDIHGCVQCMGDTSNLTGSVSIYYDEAISKQVETTELNIKQVSWRELAASTTLTW